MVAYHGTDAKTFNKIAVAEHAGETARIKKECMKWAEKEVHSNKVKVGHL